MRAGAPRRPAGADRSLWSAMMGKAEKKQPWQIEAEKRQQVVQWHRDELPGNDDEPELIEQYGLATERYHRAALKNDEAGMLDAVARMQACVANLWGCSP